MSARRRGRHHSHGGGTATAAPQGSPEVRQPLEGTSPAAPAEAGELEEASLPADGQAPPEAEPAAGESTAPDGSEQPGPARDGQPRPQRQAPERQARRDTRPAPKTEQEQPLPEPAEATGGRKASCTAAQLRRFIKSRPYVPLHELRRRFAIEGPEDEVGSFATEKGTLYVGLPQEEAALLGELVRAGEVGCELLLDPSSPAVIGVFPMRPVARG